MAGELAEGFVRWVARLVSRDLSPHTRAGYVSDTYAVALCLLDVLGRPVPAGLQDAEALAAAAAEPRVARLAAAGVRPATYVRARAVLGALAPGDLVPTVVEEAFSLHAAGRAPASRSRAVSAWNGYCTFLVRAGTLPANPLDAVDWDRPRRRLPKPVDARVLEDILAVVQQPDPRSRRPWPARDVALFATLYSTGIRLAEALGATVASLQYWGTLTPLLRVVGKGRKPRVLRLTAEVADLLAAYLAERAERLGPPGVDDPLFVRADGTAFSPGALRRLVDTWYRRAGHTPPEGAVVHSLRHTFATDAIRAGAPLRDLQEVMGHASLETTAGYLKVLGEAGERVMENHPSRALLRHGPGSRTANAQGADRS